MSREPSTSQGERARRVVETAVGTRTYTANRTIERSPNVAAIGADDGLNTNLELRFLSAFYLYIYTHKQHDFSNNYVSL